MNNEEFFKDSEQKKKAIGLIHRVYLTWLKNSRKYLASTKTKAEIRGGGKKPWKQKGTGQARAGSNRSPLWVGGGVIFGPKPRIVSKKINKKERRLAILSAFYLKKNKILILQENFFEDLEIGKTNNLSKKISTILPIKKETKKKKLLFILPNTNKTFWQATKNMKNITLTTANCLNLSQLLEAEHIFLPKSSFEIINQIYGKTE
jgi:large subunit ribosomal protein L4